MKENAKNTQKRFEYRINSWKNTYMIRIERHNYMNGRLAINLVCVPANEPFGVITVNIDYPLSRQRNDLAFVDTNNFPDIESWLKDNKLAVPTGYYGKSGYCCYPEYKFDLSKLYG